MTSRFRAMKALIHDAVDFTVDLVEEGHESVGRNAMRVLSLVAPARAPAQLVNELRRATTALALDSVRGVNRVVERLTDSGLDSAVAVGLVPWLEASPSAPIAMRSDVVGSGPWLTDAALGALNGAVGDYLHRENNGLGLGLSLRLGDQYFSGREAPELPSRRLVVLVHGLGATEWSWCWEAEAYHGDPSLCFGSLLERDLGYCPIYVRYNSGRRVFESGRALSDALEQLVSAREVDELILIGHSMGGLVVRSACQHASERGQQWVRRVTRVFSLGAPHQGAPLEKLGHLATLVLGSIDLPAARIPAEILRRRSAGIRDLGKGVIADELELDPDALREPRERQVPLLDHIAYYFVAATLTRDREHPVGQLVGDLLVRVASASGPALSEHEVAIETECFGGIVHHELQNHPDVYALVRRACESGQV